MTWPTVTLISVFGSVAYLAIGTAFLTVLAAKFPTFRYRDRSRDYQTYMAHPAWGFSVLLWPLVAPVAIVVYALVGISMLIGAVSMRGIKRLNPTVERWWWD